MPLTEKGAKIKGEMQEQYGEEKGERVFYASKNKGTITGVDMASIGKENPPGSESWTGGTKLGEEDAIPPLPGTEPSPGAAQPSPGLPQVSSPAVAPMGAPASAATPTEPPPQTSPPLDHNLFGDRVVASVADLARAAGAKR